MIFLDSFNNTNYYCTREVLKDISRESLIEFFQKAGERTTFHFTKNGVNFYTILTIDKVQATAHKTLTAVSNIELLSLSAVKDRYSEAPETENEFVKSMSRCIHITEPSTPPEELKSDNEPIETGSESPHLSLRPIRLGNGLEVILSKEMRNNVTGKRGNDHYLSIDLIRTCAQKKQKQLKAMQTGKATPFYFQTGQPNQTLVMVFLKYLTPSNEPKILAYTGYYMTDAQIRYHLNFKSETALEAWKAALPVTS